MRGWCVGGVLAGRASRREPRNSAKLRETAKKVILAGLAALLADPGVARAINRLSLDGLLATGAGGATTALGGGAAGDAHAGWRALSLAAALVSLAPALLVWRVLPEVHV